jgi:hypothetical protein
VSTQQPLAPIIEGLGVQVSLDPEERITEVLVIAKTVDMDSGVVAVTIASNELDWIAQAGLAAAYGQVIAGIPPVRGDDEDDGE